MDNGVKIGLGATVGAISTLVAQKKIHAHEITTERLRRRLDILEAVSTDCTSFMKVLTDFWALMADWASGRQDDEHQKRCLKFEKAFWRAFAALTKGQNSLLLLGERDAGNALAAMAGKGQEFYKSASVTNENLKSEDVDGFKQELGDLRDNLWKHLEAAYARENFKERNSEQ